jgi:glycosyltransferase involved in cell wall biosynthesis
VAFRLRSVARSDETGAVNSGPQHEPPIKPLVSAIIPTYNRAQCVPRAIESILAQRGVGEEFEVEAIVVDDGSTDATEEVVRRYSRVRYIRLPSRQGVSAALNHGVRASTGSFLSFLGDDDVWLPHKLELQVAVLSANPEVGVVYGQAVVPEAGSQRLYPSVDRAPSGWVFREMLMYSFCGHHAAFLARREALKQAGEFDESLATFEDYDVSLRMARYFQFLFVPAVVTVYNQSPNGQYLGSVASGAAARDLGLVIEKALRTLPDSPDYAAHMVAARALAAIEPTSALDKIGEVARAREQLLDALQTYPSALDHDWGRRYVASFAARRVREGISPGAVVGELYGQLHPLAGPDRARLDWWLELLAALRRQARRQRPRSP